MYIHIYIHIHATGAALQRPASLCYGLCLRRSPLRRLGGDLGRPAHGRQQPVGSEADARLQVIPSL